MISELPILTEWGTVLPSPAASLRAFRSECLRQHDLTLLRPDLPLDVLLRIKVNLETGCWEWQGQLNHNGYGLLGVRVPGKKRKRKVRVHRFVYEHRVGPIPEDRPRLDHFCRNHPCCWDEHLDPKTHVHNVQAGAEDRYHLRTRQPPLDWDMRRNTRLRT